MRSIGFKLWVWMVAFVALLLILLWMFQIVFLDSFYTSMKMSELKKEGYKITDLVANGNKEEAKKQIDRLSYENNASITIIDIKGNELYASAITDSMGTMSMMPMYRNAVVIDSTNNVLSGNEVNVELTHPRFGNKFYFIGIPIKSNTGVIGAFIMNTPLAPVNDTAKILQKQLGIITIILLFITVIFAYFLSRTFSKPILIIAKTAEDISSGDYNSRIKIKSKDEIGRLSETINNMARGLSKVEGLRKDLIANVSHELRTPLTLIRSYAETIRDVSGENKEKRDNHLDVIIEESERLSMVVDDILSLSQMQSGNVALNISEFEINNFINGIVGKYELLSQKTGVKIVFENNSKVIVKADEEKLKQVLYNLINNSFNYTSSGGQITISAIDVEDTIKISVNDTGTGIPESELSSIWERYYKGNNKMGTGLGLAIVKSILDAHGYNYGVESTFGEGTSIWFEIKK